MKTSIGFKKWMPKQEREIGPISLLANQVLENELERQRQHTKRMLEQRWKKKTKKHGHD